MKRLDPTTARVLRNLTDAQLDEFEREAEERDDTELVWHVQAIRDERDSR